MYNFLFPVMSIRLLYFCTFFLEYHPQPSTARRTGAATSSAGRRSQRTTPSQNRGATQRRGTAARRGATPKRRGRPPGSRNVRLRPIPEEETTDAQTSDDEDVNGKASNIKVRFQLCVLNIIQLLWSLYYIHHMYILLLANIFDLCFYVQLTLRDQSCPTSTFHRKIRDSVRTTTSMHRRAMKTSQVNTFSNLYI